VLNQNKSKMGFKWGQELLKAKAIIADLYQTILALREENEELKAEIAMIKTPLVERANDLLKKINPNISVSEKNSISQLQEMILELEIAMIKKDYKLVKKIKSPLVDN
jgi:hypothetical protein